VPKKSLLGAFWYHLGRLFGDISEDLGWIFSTYSLVMPHVFLGIP